MAVLTVDQHAGHGFGTLPGIEIAAGGAEAGVAPEGDELHFAAPGTAIHRATKSGIAAVDHLIDVFNLGRAGMHGIDDFFIMVAEDVLQDVAHSTIMIKIYADVNQNPSRLRGQGS